MRFRFLHAADLHLDTPFTGMRRVDASLVATLRDATTRAFDNLVKAALEHSVAFVVIAGDIYDGPERGVRAQLAFRNGLDRLAQAGIPSFVVHGNHDPVEGGWSAVRKWPAGVTVFGPESVATVPVERDGQTLALIHGIQLRAARDQGQSRAWLSEGPSGMPPGRPAPLQCRCARRLCALQPLLRG